MRTIPTVAQRLNHRNGRNFPIKAACTKRFCSLPALLALTDTQRCPDPSKKLSKFPKGSALIFRNRNHPDRMVLARYLRQLCNEYAIQFFWAGSAAEGLQLQADGLYLRDDTKTRAKEIQRWKQTQNGLVFCAVHTPRAVRHAEYIGADGLLLSPVFSTLSHPDMSGLGITRFRNWSRKSKLPIYALGGITEDTIRQLLTTNSVGIAGIDWFLNL